MKRKLFSALALALMIMLAACSGQTEPEGSASPSSSPSQSLAAATEQPSETPEVSETPVETATENDVIRLSTTTSVNDSGLLPYLQPQFEKESGYKLEITSAGTGAAIEKARSGDADALLVHSKTAEEEFIAEGFAEERIPFMYNFFVILGPEDDPAGVKDCATASEAFKKIAESKQAFISRGDESGTHNAELKIWKAAELEPTAESDEWYISAGDGMGAVITMAAEQKAYTLSDKATYLAHEKRPELSILMEESDEMKNTYSMLAVSPEKWPDTNIFGARTFIEWMQTDTATEMIEAYGVEEYGEKLFFVGN